MSGRVVITGCSGGGKSTLLDELARRGHITVPEPGRRIVQDQMARDGKALPWLDMEAFARLAMQVSLQDLAGTQTQDGWVFFDRGLVDAAVALSMSIGVPVRELIDLPLPYHTQVFIVPPWEEIYARDVDRQHDFEEAVAEYDRLRQVYPALGHELIELPKVSVAERADFVLATLDRG